MRPHATDLGKAGVHVAGLVLHLYLTGFKDAETEEVLDEMLQPLSAGIHVPQNFALAFIEGSELLTCKEFHVAVQNRQWSLQVMSCRGQGIRCAQESFPQLGVLLQQLCRTQL